MSAAAYKVSLKHPRATDQGGLCRHKVVGIETATQYPTYIEAQRAMYAWLDYAERRELWTGEVLKVEGISA